MNRLYSNRIDVLAWLLLIGAAVLAGATVHAPTPWAFLFAVLSFLSAARFLHRQEAVRAQRLASLAGGR